MLRQMQIVMQNESTNISDVEKGKHTQVYGYIGYGEYRQTLIRRVLIGFVLTTDMIKEYGWQYQKAECLVQI